eukprot:TRINITY_DN2626_c0_g2_i1.p1 TRINITY_DN2626_c0_g2~~TRINITY_DN2626_c0_g2_i1.p1  ORF type:complete len:1192 (+),score=320.81 TRINITY_DN2626_c0_g2_i1:339-3578(+)
MQFLNFIQNFHFEYEFFINQTIDSTHWIIITNNELFFNNGSLSEDSYYFRNFAPDQLKIFGPTIENSIYIFNFSSKSIAKPTNYAENDSRHILFKDTLNININNVPTDIWYICELYDDTQMIFDYFDNVFLYDSLTHISFGRVDIGDNKVNIVSNFYPKDNVTNVDAFQSILTGIYTTFTWPLDPTVFPQYIEINFMIHEINCFYFQVGTNRMMGLTTTVPSRKVNFELILSRCLSILSMLSVFGLVFTIYFKLQHQTNIQSFNSTEESFKIRNLNEEKTQLFEALIISQRFRRRLLTNISHELKTPLNAIIGLTSVILADKSHEISSGVREKIQHVYSCGNQLSSFFSDMLDLTPGPQISISYNENPDLIEIDSVAIFKKLFENYDGLIEIVHPFYERLPVELPSINSLKILLSLILDHCTSTYSKHAKIEVELQVIPPVRLANIDFFDRHSNTQSVNSSISHMGKSDTFHNDQIFTSVSPHLEDNLLTEPSNSVLNFSTQKQDLLHFIITVKNLPLEALPISLPEALDEKNLEKPLFSVLEHGVSNHQLKKTLIGEVINSFPGKIWVNENSFHISTTDATINTELDEDVGFSQFESLALFMGCRILLVRLKDSVAHKLSTWLLRWGFYPYTTDDIDEVLEMLDTQSCDLMFISADLEQSTVTDFLCAFKDISDENSNNVTNFRIISCGESVAAKKLHDLKQFPLPFVQLPLRLSYVYEKLIVVCQQMRIIEKNRFDTLHNPFSTSVTLTHSPEQTVKYRASVDNSVVSNDNSVLNSRAFAKLLIADDNALNAAVLKSILNMLGQVDITIVDNGLKAVEICAKFHFDIVFMDIGMPVMDGVTAMRRIRTDLSSRLQPTYIVAVTADTENGARERYNNFDGYCPKPLELSSFHSFCLPFFEKLGYLDTIPTNFDNNNTSTNVNNNNTFSNSNISSKSFNSTKNTFSSISTIYEHDNTNKDKVNFVALELSSKNSKIPEFDLLSDSDSVSLLSFSEYSSDVTQNDDNVLSDHCSHNILKDENEDIDKSLSPDTDKIVPDTTDSMDNSKNVVINDNIVSNDSSSSSLSLLKSLDSDCNGIE